MGFSLVFALAFAGASLWFAQHLFDSSLASLVNNCMSHRSKVVGPVTLEGVSVSVELEKGNNYGSVFVPDGQRKN